MIHGVWEPRSSEHCHHHHGKETFQVNSTQNPNHQNWWTTKEKKRLREETSTAAASGTSGCRWMQMMMATSYNNRSVDITHNQTTNITPIQNGSDSDFWNACYNFSTMFSQIVCLFIVSNWAVTESHAQSKPASQSEPLSYALSWDLSMRLLAELVSVSYLINNSECFETLTTKPPTDIIFCSKLIIPFFNCVGTWHSYNLGRRRRAE